MTDNRVKKGIKNSLFGLSSELIILLLGLLVPRVIVISYGSEVNGLLSSTTQLLSYLALFEAGMNSIMCNSLYSKFANMDKSGVSGVYNAGVTFYKRISLWYLIALSLGAFLFSFIIKSEISRVEIFLVVILSGLCNVVTFYFISAIKNLIDSDGNYYFISIQNLLIKVLNYGVTIVGALLLLNIVTIKLLCLGVTLIQILLYRLYYRKKYNWIDRSIPPISQQFSQKKFFFIHQIASLFFSCTDIMLLTFFVNLISVSIYTVYNSVTSAISLIMNSFSSAFMFALGQAYSENKEKYIRIHDSFKMLYLSLYFSLITICYYLFIPFVAIYMRGADVNYANQTYSLLFCLVSLVSSTRMVDNHLASISWHVKETVPHVITEAIINIVISIVLVRKYGISGVLIGTLVALVFRFFISVYYSESKILKRRLINGYKYALLQWVIFILLALGFHYVFPAPYCENLFDFLVVGIISSLLIIGVYAVANIIIFRRNAMYIWGLVRNLIGGNTI